MLQPEDDSLLREGRLLSEEPGVLQHQQDAEVLSGRREVCDSDPRRQHRHQTGHQSDLLPAARFNSYPVLCCPSGQVALNSPGFRTPPPGISPFCCPPSQICGSGTGRFCANLQSDSQNCGQCGTVCASGICSGGICALP